MRCLSNFKTFCLIGCEVSVISLLLLCIPANLARAATPPQSCVNTAWIKNQYTSERTGETTSYRMKEGAPTSADLICIIGSEFFSRVGNFPNKATVVLADKATTRIVMAKWDLTGNLLLISVLSTSGNSDRLVGQMLKLPEPLMRLGEIVSGTSLIEPISKYRGREHEVVATKAIGSRSALAAIIDFKAVKPNRMRSNYGEH